MSRTYHKTKGPGYEYWGKRNKDERDPGPYTKRRTHRKERRDAKALCQKAL